MVSLNSGDVSTDIWFEHLPTPCLYLNDDHRIEQINAAARELLVLPKSGRSLGVVIHETNFSSFLDDPATLKESLDKLLFTNGGNGATSKERIRNGAHSKNGTRSYAGDLRNSRTTRSGASFAQEPRRSPGHDNNKITPVLLPSAPASPLQWQMSRVTIQNETVFSLCGFPRMSWKDTRMTDTEQHDFLHKLIKPTFVGAPYYVSVLGAGASKQEVNATGQVQLAAFLETATKQLYPGMWDEAFVEQITLEQGVGPTSLKQGSGEVSFVRGLENVSTGMRTIHDATTTVLQNPWTDKPLGVVAQVRDPIEYSDYLQRIDLLACREEAAASGALDVMVRTMLLSGEIDYFSNSWESYTSQDRKDLLSSFTEWVHPEDLPKVQYLTSSSVSSGKPAEYQIRLRRGQAWHHFKERLAPLLLSGKIVRWYCITTDIQDLVLEREKAQSHTERLYRVINNMSLVIFEVDEFWKVTQAEGALKVITSTGHSMTAADYPGSSLYDICSVIRPGGIDELMDELVRVMNGEQAKCVVDYELGQQHLRTIAITAVDKSLDTGKRLFGITMDITAERETELAKVQVQTMQETSRLKSQFLANISHELRTPISGLVGLLDLLADTNLNKTQQDHISTLGSLAQTLLTIVNDVLDLSKSEAGGLTICENTFDFVEVVNDVCKSNEILISKKGVAFDYAPPTASSLTLGDPGRIRQIIQNLLGNAVKFTSKGYITVEFDSVDLENSVRLRVQITDTGIGIEPSAMQLLFQPFVQADQSTTRVFGGTGLGLSIARNLARLMDGDITLQSEVDKGTRAVFTVELRKPSPESLSVESPTSTSPVLARRNLSVVDQISLDRLSPLHVLVAEDNKVNQKVVLFHLKKLGVHHISLVQNGAEAVTFIQEALSSYSGDGNVPDLVLMDCQMPILDGYDATRRLRAEFGYDRPIIALTASAIEGDRQRCLDAGMDDHIPKPVSQQELSKTMKKWLLPR